MKVTVHSSSSGLNTQTRTIQIFGLVNDTIIVGRGADDIVWREIDKARREKMLLLVAILLTSSASGTECMYELCFETEN